MSTKLPRQVQADLEAAEAIEQRMTAPTDPQAEVQPDPAPEPAPEPAPAPEPQPAPEPAEPPVENWEQKYLTLQGIHRADVNRLTGERDAYKAQVDELTQKLAARPEPTPEPQAPEKLVTEKDVDAFGEDLVDLIGRKAREIAAEQLGPLKAQLAAAQAEIATTKGTVDSVATTAKAVSDQAFYAGLTEAVSDWRAVNQDQGFLNWLGQVDPLYGQERQALLEDAHAKRDVNRVAAVFQTYKATLPAPATPAVKPDLTRQVSPDASASPTPTPPNAVPTTYTPDMIQAYYTAVTKGEFKGREAEAKRIEQEIDRQLSASR